VSNDEVKKDQPLILAIETATRAGGVALARGETVLGALSGDPAISHSTNLIAMIQKVLSEAEVTLSDVDLFAVAVGPGSFTGLRIGLATVKAFAVHLDRKVVGVATLAAVAHASGARGGVVSLLPAGRGEVFAQRFSIDQGEVNTIDEAQHLSPTAVTQRYSGLAPLTFAGEGLGMFEKAGAANNIDALLPTGPAMMPLASSVAVLGFEAYRQGEAVTPDDLHAVYVRASDAEINERWQQQKKQQAAEK
jgi:tRNA threonylcarbamoyladenosine biosynthesis protein TsaB